MQNGIKGYLLAQEYDRRMDASALLGIAIACTIPLPLWAIATVIGIALGLAVLVWFGFDRWSDIVQ